MKRIKESSTWLLYSIILSTGVLGFISFKEPLSLIFAALLSVIVLVFKR